MERKTAIQKIERKAFGGSFYDSFTWGAMFRKYKPVELGVMGAQTYASELGSHMVNKPFLWHTLASGNVYELPAGHNDFSWSLMADADVRMSITRDTTETYPGKDNAEFEFFGDKGWFHEPVVLKTESRDMPMIKVIGSPTQVSANEWRYVGVVQDGNPMSYIDPAYLSTDKTLIDGTTQVADELNIKYAGLSFGNMFNLQSHIGYVARKIEVTDKFIRLEKSCREKGERVPNNQGYKFGGRTHNEAIGTGYVIGSKPKTGEQFDVKAGVFVTTAEMMLEERLAMDKEFAMQFGRLQVTEDPDTGRPIKSPAGWLQIVKDGHYKQHNGNLNLSDFWEFLNAQFTTRKDFMDRHTVIRAGSGGLEFFSRLIAAEAGASSLVFQDSYFIDRTTAEHTPDALKFGAQFTRIRLPNGHLLEVMFDPSKDNNDWYPEKADGTNYSKESFSFDIWDLGSTDAAPAAARTKSNLAMVMEPDAEEYFTVSNVYDFETGSIKNGGNAYALNKEAGVYRGSSFALAVWDTSRIARWEYR